MNESQRLLWPHRTPQQQQQQQQKYTDKEQPLPEGKFTTSIGMFVDR